MAEYPRDGSVLFTMADRADVTKVGVSVWVFISVTGEIMSCCVRFADREQVIVEFPEKRLTGETLQQQY